MNEPDSDPGELERQPPSIIFGNNWPQHAGEIIHAEAKLRIAVYCDAPKPTPAEVRSFVRQRLDQLEEMKRALRANLEKLAEIYEFAHVMAIVYECQRRFPNDAHDVLYKRALARAGVSQEQLAATVASMVEPSSPVSPKETVQPLTVTDAFRYLVNAHQRELFADQARTVDAPELVDRVERTLSGIEAVLRRVNPVLAEQMKVFGPAFEQGLTVSGVARALGVSKHEALDLLDLHGYARKSPLEGKAREEALAKLRRDMHRRGGKPEFPKELTADSVIASSRIEGVHAEPWIAPKKT